VTGWMFIHRFSVTALIMVRGKEISRR